MSHTIKRIEVKDFLAFKGEFTSDFCPGINILIGENGTGKTTLLRCIYLASRRLEQAKKNSAEISPADVAHLFGPLSQESERKIAQIYFAETTYSVELTWLGWMKLQPPQSKNPSFEHPPRTVCPDHVAYIPEKDILEHARGLLTFIEQKQTGFSRIYKDILIASMDVPTRKQNKMQKSIGEKIAAIIGGTVQWDKSDGSFYTLRTDGSKIPFANEASGFKKLGYLGLLISTGQLEKNSILFWDEPENSLNPELMPDLVNILLELQRQGVQIFIATHSKMLANEFNVSEKGDDKISFISLYKDSDKSIKASADSRFALLTPNKLTEASVEQYEREIEKGLGGND